MGAENYVHNGVFTVSIYGMDLSFSKVSGLGSKAEFDTYIEGGGRMHLLPKPKSAPGSIIFEKGISVIDKETAGIFVPGIEISDILITLKKNNNVIETYYIETGIVEFWELGDLDAISSGVAIKKFSVLHTGIKRE